MDEVDVTPEMSEVRLSEPTPQQQQEVKSSRSHSGSKTKSKVTSGSIGGKAGGEVDMKAIMAASTVAPPPKHVKKEVSWTNLLPNKDLTEEAERIVFSEFTKRGCDDLPEIQFTRKFVGPTVKDVPLRELTRLPGHVPVMKLFHVESHREREGSSDDALDEDDLTAADGIIRRPKAAEQPRESRRRSLIYDSIKLTKGEFVFTHKTYRPKVQVPYRVAPGQVPQAVAIERLHRLYKRTDINLVCQNLGIELSDLIPPSHYGENTEKFYQEAMFRNRTRVNGTDKREFIRNGGRELQELHAGEQYRRSQDDIRSDVSGSESDSSESDQFQGDIGAQQQFINAKPPFGAQFPLDFFDNTEYDIRSGQDWINLGYDASGYRLSAIPGKAFLPIPESRGQLPSLAEVTYVDLLKKTNRLDAFRKWLLLQRYLRRAGPNARVSQAPNERDLMIIARSTTAMAMALPGSGDSPEGVPQTALFSPKQLVTSTETDGTDEFSPDLYTDEYEGEGSEGSGPPSENSAENILNDIVKLYKRKEKSPEEEQEDHKSLTPVKSESILSDIFSDANSQILVPEFEEVKASSQILGAQFQKPTKSVFEMSASAQGLPKPGQPGHPDFDPYENDGYQTLVYEYNKMKRVQNYDWKWVDVAIFDYDPETSRYFVRSIFPPFVYAWVGKLYLVMDGENAAKHGERIREAIIRRIESEYKMRYNLYVDCLPVTNAPELPPQLLEIINLKTLSTPRLQHTKSLLKKVEQEIVLEWQRTHMQLYFDSLIEKHPKLYRPWVVHLEDPLEEKDWDQTPSTKWEAVKGRMKECATYCFGYKVTRVQRASVIYKTEPYMALQEVVAACFLARQQPFILTNQGESLHIEPYEAKQKEQMQIVQEYLRNEWMESVLSSIRVHLEKIPKSWYNINEDRWSIYNLSKLSNYLTLIRFYMEDTLCFMVEESLAAFVGEIKTLTEGCQYIGRDYEWTNSLHESDFPPPPGMVPPFKLELTMDKYGPKYTQYLKAYPVVATRLFDSCIESACGIPDVVPLIMKNLLFGTGRNLHSTHKDEPAIVQLGRKMRRYMNQGLIPVDIYAQKFQYYMPVWNLDVAEFMKEWESKEHTTKEIRHTVDFHVKHMQEIETEIPTVIDINAFRVNVEVVKTNLIKKKKALHMAILDSFAAKLRNLVITLRDEFIEIERKLTTRSDDIEEVMELKLYVETVPQILMQREEVIAKMLKDYDMFETFKYPIPAQDVEFKWAVAVWTNRLSQFADDAALNFDDDYERLLKVQTADESALSDAVDSVTLSVAGLVAYVEVEKANEVAQEVKKIWKQVKDLEEQNDKLNKRQEIFGLPPGQNEALERLIRDFEPFKNLWFTAAEWIKIQESVFKGTLDKVDIVAVSKITTDGDKTMKRCIRYFAGADAIQHIAMEIRHQILDFKEIVPIIHVLKNTGMRQRHWEDISNICGFKVVANKTQNFQKLVDQGIGEFIEPIVEVGVRATNEAQIESALDKMQKEINKFRITVHGDPKIGMQTITLPEGVMKVIDTHMIATEEILTNPYRAPFDERISNWEIKIRRTKENLELWLKCQKEWVDIQPEFKIPDVEVKLPTEYKLFLKMERIWRRVMRMVRDMPDVLDIGSDTMLRASIQQMENLLEKCRRGIEERMKPEHSDSDEDIPAKSTASLTGKADNKK